MESRDTVVEASATVYGETEGETEVRVHFFTSLTLSKGADPSDDA